MQQSAAEKVERQNFGRTTNGVPVELFTLRNSNGMVLKITNYGATLVSLEIPSSSGKTDEVVLGFRDLRSYEKQKPYFGATIGRVANRIASAQFQLDGQTYNLNANNGLNTLHGGRVGFDKRCWKAEPTEVNGEQAVTLTYTSMDMEEGFPGNLTVAVIYKLTKDNAVEIDYQAVADKPTPVNLTNHSYFNLSGAGKGNILNHRLRINADKYAVVDDALIPTGELRSVESSPMDFRKPIAIGMHITKVPGGYDHNYVINNAHPGTLVQAADVTDPESERRLEMFTTEPGVQLYSGNFLDGSEKGNGGAYKQYFGFCLEAQHFPDSVHHPQFPSIILRPGEVYKQTTVYRFFWQ